jgi:2-haloacid dehalogenase
MRLAWVLFDLNGTLLDPAALALPLGGGEAARALVGRSFTTAILMSMAATLSDAPYRPLDEYLSAAIERELRASGEGMDKLSEVLGRAKALDPFEDADPALRLLRGAGARLAVLTNSTAESAEQSLRRSGLRPHFDAVLGSDAVGAFKPDPRVYLQAVHQLGTAASEICLVAAHAWDVMGAKRAGLAAGWVARLERWLMPTVPEPDFRGRGLMDVASAIVGSSAQ